MPETRISFGSAGSSPTTNKMDTSDDFFDYICGIEPVTPTNSPSFNPQLAGQRVLNASIQVDSKHVDGSAAESFLERIRHYLERPGELII